MTNPLTAARQALNQALQQWKMYAELDREWDTRHGDEGRDLKSEQSAEGDLYRTALAALDALDAASEEMVENVAIEAVRGWGRDYDCEEHAEEIVEIVRAALTAVLPNARKR